MLYLLNRNNKVIYLEQAFSILSSATHSVAHKLAKSIGRSPSQFREMMAISFSVQFLLTLTLHSIPTNEDHKGFIDTEIYHSLPEFRHDVVEPLALRYA